MFFSLCFADKKCLIRISTSFPVPHHRVTKKCWSHAKIILVKDNIRKLCKWAYLNVDWQNKLLEVGAVVKVVVVDVVLVLIKSFLLLTAIRRINVFMVMVRNLRVVSIGAAVATMPIGRRVDKLSTPLAVVVMATNPISFCVRFPNT